MPQIDYPPKHLGRPRRSLEERFWEKVKKTPTCWLFTGGKDQQGYGLIWVPTGSPPRWGRSIGAHIISWELHNGPVPEGLWVLHNCPEKDCTSCVNPDHLWLGTNQDNNADMVKKGVYCQGKTHPKAKKIAQKLNDELIHQIMTLRCSGLYFKEIAKITKISEATLSRIANKDHWFYRSSQ